MNSTEIDVYFVSAQTARIYKIQAARAVSAPIEIKIKIVS